MSRPALHPWTCFAFSYLQNNSRSVRMDRVCLVNSSLQLLLQNSVGFRSGFKWSDHIRPDSLSVLQKKKNPNVHTNPCTQKKFNFCSKLNMEPADHLLPYICCDPAWPVSNLKGPVLCFIQAHTVVLFYSTMGSFNHHFSQISTSLKKKTCASSFCKNCVILKLNT